MDNQSPEPSPYINHHKPESYLSLTVGFTVCQDPWLGLSVFFYFISQQENNT